METNNNQKLKKNKKKLSDGKTSSLFNDKRRKSLPITPNNILLKRKISKSKHIRSSINSSKNNKLKKFFHENNNNEKNSIVDLDYKRKKSIVFTEHLLKQKIEEDLTAQIHKNSKDKIKNENFPKVNTSNNSEKEKSFTKLKKGKKSKNDDKMNDSKREYKRNFYKKKLIYDSLEDSELSNNNDDENYFISPETTFILIFDFLIYLFLIIYIIYIPLKMSYHNHNYIYITKSDKIYFFALDALFMIDLLISLFRAYYNHELKLITTNRKIIKTFCARYFIYDLIAAFPFLSLIVHYHKNIIVYNINDNKDFFLLLTICLKLFKCKKVKEINKFNDNINEFFSRNYLTEQIFSAVKMIFISFLFIHILICFHIFIGFHFYPSWLSSIKERSDINSYISIYITSFYFLITTLTTVGYGDIVCISIAERVFQIIELSLGVVLYSYVVTKIGDMVKNESYLTIIYNNKLAVLEDIRINYPKMPYKLYNKIKHHLQSNVQNQKKTNINLLINNLPHILRHNLLLVLYKNYVNNFTFFRKCYNSNFIIYTLLNFVPYSSKKNSLLLREDQLIDNVIFVIQGRLSLEIAIDLENPKDSIKKYLSEQYNPLAKNGIIEDKYNQRMSTVLHNNEIKNMESSINNGNINIARDSNNNERDFDESNYHFINITNIFKNEHFGEVFILFNKPSPLFLRVKSKMANLFLLNKKNILVLSTTYFNIWKRLFKKSLKNMIALRERTIEIVKKYHSNYKDKFPNKNKNQSKNSPKKEDNKTQNKKNLGINKYSGTLKSLLSNNISHLKYNKSYVSQIQNQDSDIFVDNTVEKKGRTVISKNLDLAKIEGNEKDEKSSNKNKKNRKNKGNKTPKSDISKGSDKKKEKTKKERISLFENNTSTKHETTKLVDNNISPKKEINKQSASNDVNKKIETTICKNKDNIPLDKDKLKKENSHSLDYKTSKNMIRKAADFSYHSSHSITASKEKMSLNGNKIVIYDEEFVNQLQNELEEEKKQRKYYQKLYQETEKKNKDLCFQLLTKSINSPSPAGDEPESINNSNFSKLLMTNLSQRSPKKRLKGRSLSVEFRKKKDVLNLNQNPIPSPILNKTPNKTLKKYSKSIRFVHFSKFNQGSKKIFSNINIFNFGKNDDNIQNFQILEKKLESQKSPLNHLLESNIIKEKNELNESDNSSYQAKENDIT